MAERAIKPEISSQKRTLKLPPAIGDWTTYRPVKALVKKVKSGLYGFDRLSNDELDLVLKIHYSFIQKLTERLKIDLGMGIEFSSCSVEQTTYLNVLRTITSPVVTSKLQLPGIHEGVQFILDLNMVHSLVNHALGSRDLELLHRGLTEAENVVVKQSLEAYLPMLAEAFAGVISNPELSQINSPDLTPDPAINASTTFVSFSAELTFNDNPSGRIVFGYLASTLKGLLKQYKEKQKAKPLNFSRFPSGLLNRLRVPIIALLGKTNLLTTELHHLEVGDVVSLDSPINSAIAVTVGSELKVKAQPGLKNKKKAIRLAGFSEENIIIEPPVEVTSNEVPPAPLPTVSTPITPPPQPLVEPPPPAAAEPAAVLEKDILSDDDFSQEDLEDFDEEFGEEEFLEDETKTGGM